MKEIEKYLNKNFETEEVFILNNDCTKDDIYLWQKSHIFPYPSYTTNKKYVVYSFFGEQTFNEFNKWYSKGLSEWIYQIKKYDYNHTIIKDKFIQRYLNTLDVLKKSNIYDLIYDNTIIRSQLPEEEWEHFLNGTYGVCTKNNTPEQIAIKEVTIRVIDRITEKQQAKTIPSNELDILMKSVKLLDEVSSFFAPHERKNNSRNRCIELVRKKYLSHYTSTE